MAVFEIYKTDDDGGTWVIIKNDIDGTYPCGGEDVTGRIWCFYCAENGDNIDLRCFYSDDQGGHWYNSAKELVPPAIPDTIFADIDEASLSFWVDEFGFHWISYWKDDKPYSAFHNPSDAPNIWTSKEVKE